jgi:hypothetical protein
MLEALLATPFYMMGIPVNIALPTVTTLLNILPFLIIAYILFFKRKEDTGLLILFLPLLLPVEYDLITTMPRGFVTGLAFVGIACFWLESKRNSAYYLFGLFILLGFTVNPNSILFSLPIALLFFFKNYQRIQLYFFGLAGGLSGLLVHLLLNKFYTNHPNYELHRPNSAFGKEYLSDGIEKWNLFFGDLIPIFWNQGWLVLIFPIICTVYFIVKRKIQYAFVSISMIPVIILPLFNVRLYNAMETIFYSYSRMYLAVPLLFALLIYLLEWKYINRLIFIPLIGVFLIKILVFNDYLDRRLNESTYILVRPVHKVISHCEELEKIRKEQQLDLIIIIDFGYVIENYACGICTRKGIKTLYPTYERRTWRLLEDSDKIYNNLLIIDANLLNNKSENAISTIQGTNNFHLIKNNKLSTYELMLLLGISPREF